MGDTLITNIDNQPEIKYIEIDNVYMSYKTSRGVNRVLKGLSLSVPSNKSLGILGRNGAGKSTFINILCGLIHPDSGTVRHNGIAMSWPIGRPTFQNSISAINNIKFICRIMGLEVQPVIEFVDDFAELGDYMYMPIKTFSSGMKSRLGFAISMAIDFDCLMVDEGFNAGDARFTNKMNEMFEKKRETKNMICVSHNVNVIKKFCDYTGILQNGQIKIYEDMDEAFAIYRKL